jgi:Phage tail protein
MGGEALMSEPLLLPVFTVDGWSGNTVDDDRVEWWVTKEEGWSSGPDVRLELANRPQRDGSFDARSFRSARVITLEGTAIAPDPDTRERAKDRIAALLMDGSRLAELAVRERTVTRRALVRLSAATKIVDRTPHSFDWSLHLTAPDPLRHSADQHTRSCGLPQPGAGLTFPVTFLLEFGEPSGGTLMLDNVGTAVAWPVWTITGPCDQPVIRNNSAGKWLGFGLRLLNGDTLVVDAAARTVRLGDASRRAAVLPHSTWFGLLPGRTAIGFDAMNVEETGVLTVTWRDAWI